jgi:hypothetical protein
VDVLYDKLAGEFSYFTQDYFESSTIFVPIIDSKYQNPLRQYFLRELSPTNEDDVILIFDNLVNKSLSKAVVEVEPIIKKKTYVIEVYIEILKNLCLYFADTYIRQQNEKEDKIKLLDHYLRVLMKMTVVFICLLTNE